MWFFAAGFFTAWFLLSVLILTLEEKHPKAFDPFVEQYGFLFGVIIAPAFIPVFAFWPILLVVQLVHYLLNKKRRNRK